MTDSIDNKSNGKRDNLKVDLDAMLDEAESSLMPRNEVLGDDTIDSLLMDSGFNVDDELERAAMRGNTPSANDDQHDELDDLLGFDNFTEGFNMQDIEDSEPVVAGRALREPEDEEDELDRLLMNVGLDLEEEAASETNQEAQALDDFDDFSDFNDISEADTIPSAQTNAYEQVDKRLNSDSEGFATPDEIDEFADLFHDGFNEADLIQDEADEVAAVEETAQEEFSLSDNAAEAVSPTQDSQYVDLFEDGFDGLDLISDEETEMSVAEASEQVGEAVSDTDTLGEEIPVDLVEDGWDDVDLVQNQVPATASSEFEQRHDEAEVNEAEAADEADEFAGLFDENFDESDLIQDEDVAAAPAAFDEEREQDNAEAIAHSDEADDFSDFSDFNEPNLEPTSETDSSEQHDSASDIDNDAEHDADIPPDDSFDDAGWLEGDASPIEVADQDIQPELDGEPPVEAVEQLDDFSSSDDFNAADSTVNEVVESIDALVSSDEFADTLDDSFSEAGLSHDQTDDTVLSEEATPEKLVSSDDTVETVDLDQEDEFAGLFADGFDDSDLISDEETQTPTAMELEQFSDLPVSEAGPSEDSDLFTDLFEDGLDEADSVQEQASIAAVPVVEQPDDGTDISEGDEFAGLFSEGFDDSDLISDEETQTPTAMELEQFSDLPVSEAGPSEDSDLFTDLFDDGLDESDGEQTQASTASALLSEQLDDDAEINEAGKLDEADEFAGLFGDDFDSSDLLDDQAAEVIVSGITDEQPAIETSEILVSDEDAFEDLLPENDLNTEDSLETEPTIDNLLDGGEEFAGLVDSFEDADLIQDEEENVSADLEALNDLQGDEEGFDSLFTDVGFDEEDTSEQAAKKGEFGDDSDFNDFFQLNEVGDDTAGFTDEAQLGGADQSSSEEDDFLLSDFDITADTEMSEGGSLENKQEEFDGSFGDSDFLNEDDPVQAFEPGATELKSINEEAIAEGGSKQASSSEAESVDNVQLAQFAFEQEDMQKQLEEAEKKTKKAKLFGYLALGFGGIALSAAAGLGYMAYNAKAELANLNATVADLQASLAKNAAPPPQEELNAMRNSVVQFNRQVNGFITELKGNPQFLVDLLNNKVPDIAEKQDMVSKALQVLQVKAGIEGGEPLEKAPVEPVKIDVAAQVKEEPAPVKSEPLASKKDEAPEPELKVTIKPKPSINIDAAKPEVVSETAAPAKTNVRPEEPVIKPAKPVAVPKVEVKEEPVQVKRPESAGKWGINLAAFKQEWFARSKAAEFARQGIFAEVVPVYEKNTTMYRLRVGGFKSKAEANASSARIKQTLNLDSVWVSDN
ncbi:MAG: SPOR domain-containing protein [Methylobacter sp.]